MNLFEASRSFEYCESVNLALSASSKSHVKVRDREGLDVFASSNIHTSSSSVLCEETLAAFPVAVLRNAISSALFISQLWNRPQGSGY